MTSRLLFAALVLLCSGCQMLSYKDATGDAVATIEFTSNETAAQPVVCVPGKGFKSTAMSVTANTSDSQFIKDMNETMRKAAKVTAQVDASTGSTKVGFVMRKPQRMGPSQRCRVAAQFSVSAGMTYSAHLTETNGQCGVEISASGKPLEDAFIVPWECQ